VEYFLILGVDRPPFLEGINTGPKIDVTEKITIWVSVYHKSTMTLFVNLVVADPNHSSKKWCGSTIEGSSSRK